MISYFFPIHFVDLALFSSISMQEAAISFLKPFVPTPKSFEDLNKLKKFPYPSSTTSLKTCATRAAYKGEITNVFFRGSITVY